MPVDVADWILAVLESTHPIIFCCWPAEIPGFVFYRAQQTLAPLGKRLKGRHQPSASRQALGGSRRLEALGTAPAPLGKRLETWLQKLQVTSRLSGVHESGGDNSR